MKDEMILTISIVLMIFIEMTSSTLTIHVNDVDLKVVSSVSNFGAVDYALTGPLVVIENECDLSLIDIGNVTEEFILLWKRPMVDCPFVGMAIQAQERGAEGVVFVNDQSISAFVTSVISWDSATSKEVTIPVSMMSGLDGKIVEFLLIDGYEVTGTLADDEGKFEVYLWVVDSILGCGFSSLLLIILLCYLILDFVAADSKKRTSLEKTSLALGIAQCLANVISGFIDFYGARNYWRFGNMVLWSITVWFAFGIVYNWAYIWISLFIKGTMMTAKLKTFRMIFIGLGISITLGDITKIIVFIITKDYLYGWAVYLAIQSVLLLILLSTVAYVVYHLRARFKQALGLVAVQMRKRKLKKIQKTTRFLFLYMFTLLVSGIGLFSWVIVPSPFGVGSLSIYCVVWKCILILCPSLNLWLWRWKHTPESHISRESTFSVKT